MLAEFAGVVHAFAVIIKGYIAKRYFIAGYRAGISEKIICILICQVHRLFEERVEGVYP